MHKRLIDPFRQKKSTPAEENYRWSCGKLLAFNFYNPCNSSNAAFIKKKKKAKESRKHQEMKRLNLAGPTLQEQSSSINASKCCGFVAMQGENVRFNAEGPAI